MQLTPHFTLRKVETDVNKWVENRKRTMSNINDSAVSYTHLDVYKRQAQMLFTIAGKFIVYNFKNNQVVSTFKPKDGANNEDYCAASGNVAYTIDKASDLTSYPCRRDNGPGSTR